MAPADAKFCSNCGAALSRPRAAEGERRVVTVLFCDVKGSTAIAETLDPEEWTEIMNGAFEALVDPISRYEGTVIRLLGDALLAFFGAPVAHEDDPERAVLAALEMAERLRDYRERLRDERGIADFDVRIGINTGLAVLGDVGAGARVEYTAMGDAVNVAARLQQAASPGSIVVGETTQKLARGLFDLRALGEIEVRGRTAPVEAFEVLGRARATRRAAELTAPLVGRDAEMAGLRGTLAELRRGQGRVVALVGEAGLGKSRLVDELLAEMSATAREERREHASLGRGQSYGQSQSFHLFQQHVLTFLGASAGDAPARIRGRIAEALGDEPQERRHAAVQALELFLGVQEEGAPIELEGEALRHELVRLITVLLRRYVAEVPGVLAFDDLHWSDPASADLLTELFALTDEVPVLFLCGFRPDRQSVAWRVKQRAETDYPHRYTEIVLRPLDAEQGATLLHHLLLGAELPVRLATGILDKAEGNPLFLEEILRVLIDDGVIARDPDVGWFVTRDTAEVRLPETIQGLVAARIDRLEEEARATLQAAAVIGRAFLYRVLRAVSESDGRIDRHLATLQRLELVRETVREPEREFVFRHALTQEAAYGSILQRRRRELHGRVAQALESLFGDRMEEYAGLVGYHFAEAGDARAIRYLKAAGDRAMRLYALEEALAHYRRAIGLLRGDKEEPRLVTELYGAGGRVLELRGEYADALALYEELEALGRRRADPKIEGAALGFLITVRTNPTPVQDSAIASELMRRAIDLARAEGDRKLLASLLWNAGQLGLWRGDTEAGLRANLESLAIARELGDREQAAFTLNSLAQLHIQGGRPDEAEASLDEATELFRALDNKPMLADCLSTRAIVLVHYRADFTGALSLSQQAYRVSEEIQNAWGRGYALFASCYSYLERGELGRALESFESCVRWSERGGFVAGQVGPGADLAWLLFSLDDEEAAVARLERAASLAEAQLPQWRAWPRVQLARIRIAQGRLAEAADLLGPRHPPESYEWIMIPQYDALARTELLLAGDHVAEAVHEAQERAAWAYRAGLPGFRGDFGWLLGEAHRRAGDVEAAVAALVDARERAESVGSRRVLWRIIATLAEVSATRGEHLAGEALRGEARAILENMAESLSERGLAERFRARPEVAAVLQLVAH